MLSTYSEMLPIYSILSNSIQSYSTVISYDTSWYSVGRYCPIGFHSMGPRCSIVFPYHPIKSYRCVLRHFIGSCSSIRFNSILWMSEQPNSTRRHRTVESHIISPDCYILRDCIQLYPTVGSYAILLNRLIPWDTTKSDHFVWPHHMWLLHLIWFHSYISSDSVRFYHWITLN